MRDFLERERQRATLILTGSAKPVLEWEEIVANLRFYRDEIVRLKGEGGNPWISDVLAFHRRFTPCLIGQYPGLSGGETDALRLRLISEEADELREAVERQDIVATADALADLIYVAIGAAITWGIPLDDVWREVHASNMRKEGGPTRADGKILKPEGWTPPDVAGVLAPRGGRS